MAMIYSAVMLFLTMGYADSDALPFLLIAWLGGSALVYFLEASHV